MGDKKCNVSGVEGCNPNSILVPERAKLSPCVDNMGRRQQLQSQPLSAEVPALGTVLFSVNKGLLNHPEAQRANG